MASAPTQPTTPAEHPRQHRGHREPLLWRALRKGWHAIGPGFITGASDDDPSGIATYSQTGAHYGYALLWTAVWQLPLLYYTQEAVARIGAVRGSAASWRACAERYVWSSRFCTAFASVDGADGAVRGGDYGRGRSPGRDFVGLLADHHLPLGGPSHVGTLAVDLV